MQLLFLENSHPLEQLYFNFVNFVLLEERIFREDSLLVFTFCQSLREQVHHDICCYLSFFSTCHYYTSGVPCLLTIFSRFSGFYEYEYAARSIGGN